MTQIMQINTDKTENVSPITYRYCFGIALLIHHSVESRVRICLVIVQDFLEEIKLFWLCMSYFDYV